MKRQKYSGVEEFLLGEGRGMSPEQIAEHFGVNRSIVYHVRERAGLPALRRGTIATPNEIEVVGDVAKVWLRNHPEPALVDVADLPLIRCYTWRAYRKKDQDTTTYVRTAVGGKTIQLHRLITAAPKGLVVDHVQHDGLDNRRANLRVVDQRTNSQNRSPASRARSTRRRAAREAAAAARTEQKKQERIDKIIHDPTYGLNLQRRWGYWVAIGRHDGVSKYLGMSKDRATAKRLYISFCCARGIVPAERCAEAGYQTNDNERKD